MRFNLRRNSQRAYVATIVQFQNDEGEEAELTADDGSSFSDDVRPTICEICIMFWTQKMVFKKFH